jgi:nucleoid-associated protein YgaU
MARYNNTTKKIKNNIRYYGTTIYRKVEEKNTDSYFIAQQGDRCDNLANRFYGNPNLWWFIAQVNNLKTNNIPAGTSLRIPTNIEDAQGF